MTSQAYAGSAQGAAAGYKVGGVWGAVIGAVVGAYGGLLGDKAAKYRRQARAEEQKAVEIQQDTQRRNLVRSVFLARSQALAAAGAQETGALQSSAPLGELSSISTRGMANLKLFDTLVARQIMEQYYLKKASKKQEQSDFVSGLISSVGNSGASFGGPSSSNNTTQTSNTNTSSTTTAGVGAGDWFGGYDSLGN